MIVEDMIKPITKVLFSQEESNLYAILDGASVPELLPKLDECQPDCYCLFANNLEPDMAEVAPYLIQLEPEVEFTDWVIEQGWGKHWGIFASSQADIRAMRQHFRSILVVYDSNYRALRFRYYDPRVMKLYLPTCNPKELGTIFGPVDYYMFETEEPNILLRCRLSESRLVQERIELIKRI
jgi:hypothetical protein